jgi:hypothetical protein
MQKNTQKYRRCKIYIKTMAHPKSLADGKNLAHPKSLDAKNLALPKSLVDAKNLAH